MKLNLTKWMSLGLLLGATAFGSGYSCKSEETTVGEWVVKMYNHTSVESRVPAVLVVSHDVQGTLIRRIESEITKVNRKNTVQYVVAGNQEIDADLVIFQVAHKEGRETLLEGEEVAGQLILVKDEAKEVIALKCARYLKN